MNEQEREEIEKIETKEMDNTSESERDDGVTNDDGGGCAAIGVLLSAGNADTFLGWWSRRW